MKDKASQGLSADHGRMPPGKAVEVTGGILDRAQRLQAPAVKKYVDSLRRKYPDDSPAQIIERLEKRYLNAVTGSGGAVGAAAAVRTEVRRRLRPTRSPVRRRIRRPWWS